jgi:hypothetical protein
MSRTLWVISEDLQALNDLLAEVDGDVTGEEAEAAIEKWFNELGEERDRKLDGYGALIKQFEAYAKARNEEAKRLSNMASVDANNAGRLKSRLKVFMEQHKTPKIETDRFKFAIQNNGGTVPVILSADAELHPEELPEKYRKVVFQPDMNAIRVDLERLTALQQQALENNLDMSDEDARELDDLVHILPSLAELGTRGTHLRIR